MINVAVLGACGRMGSLIIENITCSTNMQLVAAFDVGNIGKDAGEFAHVGNLGIQISDVKDLETVLKKTQADVLIDFTIAAATIVNAPVAAGCGVNLIIGTTGLTPEQRAVIDEAIRKNKVRAVISPNYSVGVNVFFKLLREAAKYLEDYDIEIIEAHHNQKKDAPSGTALRAADVISEALGGKEYVYGREGIAPRGKEIGIHAVRGGDITGDHTVLFVGNSERIEIRHMAHSRQIFAKGAVRAAEWVCGQTPGIYNMDDVLGL
ncbi:dihydrodipicolinate reductase [Methanosarcina sp. 2.H.T.1A.6]|uniref:4-hydroxy-tetrahydrodipicolinate reductase n=1 Tax=unclassified Methanosarcina TaxID=2644672 RepID=UPI000621BF92|nr:MULTISPECIES: 4-hydroxy-tetrahydrodipicolinate reductase [unclassified Methanosarcina]KKG14541.1 dihydrodipicolinate reductase [Methanosarcina sp. 2.H.T.1A.3]KKG23298.1 dihydrodipicolinate reductase [Methanosarcina sp. 2.H.T.1A.15]KKG24207.1 dihydrodipicolinate reductase [Methanosarcina sp. 2.H.T.1A.8]KKG24980.1 dihydrodipicolinate reductase [Methanosarcina sp. 2.H.T.1A.6]